MYLKLSSSLLPPGRLPSISESGCVVAITGPVDIVADANRAFAVRNGSPLQGRITGSGCMLSALSGAYIARREEDAAGAALAAVVHMGVAGQRAAAKLERMQGGTGSFATYLMDELSLLDGAALARDAAAFEVA